MMESEKSPRLGRISYTNVEPVYFNISDKSSEYFLINEPPSVLNRMMMESEIDLGPVSSFAYGLNFKDWLIIPDLSVSCFNDVMSVILASNYKIEDLNGKKVAFSKDSASAVNLCRLLFSNFNVKPDIETRKIILNDSFHNLYDATLVIGDNALSGKWKNYRYIYDLGELWCRKRGLPFTFALWVVRKEYAEKNRKAVKKVVECLYSSKNAGLKNLDNISTDVAKRLGIEKKVSQNYFTKLNFGLNKKQLKGLNLYYSELYEAGLLDHEVVLNFFE